MRRLHTLLLAVMTSAMAVAQNAQWITVDEPSRNATNTWMEFSKEFHVDRKCRNAETRIAADSKYWLWINGQNVVFEGGLKRGPDRESTYYDVIDIAPFLKKGKNEVRVLLWYFGKSGFSHNSSGASGIIMDSPAINLRSDSSWNSRILEEYQSCGKPEPNYRLSESNIRYDARLEDHGEWKESVALGEWGSDPWGDLVPRPIPQWKDYGISKAEYRCSEDDKGNIVLTADLPYNMQMTPVIELTDGTGGTCIQIETDHIMGGSEPCIRAEYITRKGYQKYESLGWMNGDKLIIRYPKDAMMEIHSIGYHETGYNCDREGTFTCSDSQINRFWEKAMRTLYVNMRDTYFDCPDRERAQWWGDITILIGQSFYQLSPDANALMKKAIHELVDWQRPDGTLYSPVPSGTWKKELPAQMLSAISTYGFWYYYMHTGDIETMKYAYPAIKRYLSVWKLDENGLTEGRTGEWSWGDWGTDVDIRLILASWHYLALESASRIAMLTGNDADVADFQRQRKSIYKAFNECWTGYSYRHPAYMGATDDRVHAMAILSGLADSSRYDAIFRLFQQQEYASPYMEKYVMEALFKTGHGDYALKRFKKRFGPMIEDTAHSTLYEGWEEGGYGGGSTNHAWSGGMLTVIAERVCGIRPVAAGWKEFEICPDPVIPECSIGIPSVSGYIGSSFRDTETMFMMTVSIPAGTVAKVTLPEIGYRSILINGMESGEDITLKEGKYEITCIK